VKASEDRFGLSARFRGSQRRRRKPNRIKLRLKFCYLLTLKISSHDNLQTWTASRGAW